MASSSDSSSTQPIPWVRLTAEGGAIVVSILLAFALDAWWEGRQRADEEREVLGRLEAEFAEVESVMKGFEAGHERAVEAGQALLSEMGSQLRPAIGPDSIASLLRPFMTQRTVEIPSGVLSSLMSSGQLGLIRNPELRTELATWQALMADLHADEENSARLMQDRVNPYLDLHVALRPIAVPGAESAFPGDLTALLSEREFENLVQRRVRVVSFTLLAYGAALQSLTRVQSLIGRELATS